MKLHTTHTFLKFALPLGLLCLLVVFISGCLGTAQTVQTQAEETAETEAAVPLAALLLSTPKTTYAPTDEIPLQLTIQNGKFDLLVPYYAVATKGAFTQITVTDADGQPVEPKRSITQEHPQKYVSRDGKTIRSIQGFDFKAEGAEELTFKDIQSYYQLQPGTYTLTLAIELEVYRDSITEEHPEVVELKRDLARLQSDPNLQPAAKQDALTYYQEQIKFIEDRHKAEERAIYLPVKSRRGKASLTSNPITFTVE